MTLDVNDTKVKRKRPYLLTGGLAPLFKNRYRLPLSSSSIKSLEKIELEYFMQFKEMMKDHITNDEQGKYSWDVRFIPSLEIEEKISSVVAQNKNSRPIISFDDVYCTNIAQGHYSVTRLANPFNLNCSDFPGPRFGKKSLDEQTQDILNNFGKHIDLMDVGVFCGDTLIREVEQRFTKKGLKINNVYVAFAGPQGIKNLREAGINLKYSEAIEWVDWLEMRDCIGFDGRKVMHKSENKEVYNAFVKYTEKLDDWASIPQKYQDQFKKLYTCFFYKINKLLEEDGYTAKLAPISCASPVHELKLIKLTK